MNTDVLSQEHHKRTFSIEWMSDDNRNWIRDLQAADPAFPSLDPFNMDENDVETLADYLAADDGSLNAKSLAYSRSVAAAIRLGGR